MTKTAEYLEMRLHILEQRDEVGNRNIINKLKRQIKQKKAEDNMTHN